MFLGIITFVQYYKFRYFFKKKHTWNQKLYSMDC